MSNQPQSGDIKLENIKFDVEDNKKVYEMLFNIRIFNVGKVKELTEKISESFTIIPFLNLFFNPENVSDINQDTIQTVSNLYATSLGLEDKIQDIKKIFNSTVELAISNEGNPLVDITKVLNFDDIIITNKLLYLIDVILYFIFKIYVSLTENAEKERNILLGILKIYINKFVFNVDYFEVQLTELLAKLNYANISQFYPKYYDPEATETGTATGAATANNTIMEYFKHNINKSLILYILDTIKVSKKTIDFIKNFSLKDMAKNALTPSDKPNCIEISLMSEPGLFSGAFSFVKRSFIGVAADLVYRFTPIDDIKTITDKDENLTNNEKIIKIFSIVKEFNSTTVQKNIDLFSMIFKYLYKFPEIDIFHFIQKSGINILPIKQKLNIIYNDGIKYLNIIEKINDKTETNPTDNTNFFKKLREEILELKKKFNSEIEKKANEINNEQPHPEDYLINYISYNSSKKISFVNLYNKCNDRDETNFGICRDALIKVFGNAFITNPPTQTGGGYRNKSIKKNRYINKSKKLSQKKKKIRSKKKRNYKRNKNINSKKYRK